MTHCHEPIRPAQWAALLLASGDLLPRKRARDQQADLAGSQLKQRFLRRIIELDPEPDDWLATLNQLIQEFGEPTGPSRAIARGLAEEWNSSNQDSRLTEWLLDQAVQRHEDSG
jgi:hypothetical protein